MTDYEFKEVLHQLNARSLKRFAKSLPWPYNAMVNDIVSAIQSKSNYLAALGLACYTEICGRQIIFKGDKSKEHYKCYNEFLKYIGCEELLNREIVFEGERKYFKQAVRDGLAHQYFMQVKMGTVAMISNNEEGNRFGFIITDDGQLIMLVVPYFKLFCAGLEKAKTEGKLKELTI